MTSCHGGKRVEERAGWRSCKSGKRVEVGRKQGGGRKVALHVSVLGFLHISKPFHVSQQRRRITWTRHYHVQYWSSNYIDFTSVLISFYSKTIMYMYNVISLFQNIFFHYCPIRLIIIFISAKNRLLDLLGCGYCPYPFVDKHNAFGIK